MSKMLQRDILRRFVQSKTHRIFADFFSEIKAEQQGGMMTNRDVAIIAIKKTDEHFKREVSP